jgi:hypothetical protein
MLQLDDFLAAQVTCERVNQDSPHDWVMNKNTGGGGARQNHAEDSSRVRRARPFARLLRGVLCAGKQPGGA